MPHQHIEDKSKDERIKELEEELSKTKYNKRTQYHIGLVKAKIARIKEKAVKKEKGKKAGEGYSIKKTGDATALIVGFPSVGKSSLLNDLTNAKSEVDYYDFTTLDVIPGMLNYNSAKIQILDVPGILEGASSGKGRGKEVISVTRNADLLIIMIDINNPAQYDIIKNELYSADIRINEKKPNIVITKTSKNGIRFGANVRLTWLTKELVKDIMKEFNVINAEVLVREDIRVDQFIDCIQGNWFYIPAVTVLNKIDTAGKEKIQELKNKINADIEISAKDKINIDELKEIIFKKLDIMRIYLKQIGKKPDMEQPLIIKKGSTIKDVCLRLHKDFVSRFKFARVWGSSKFDGQKFLRLDRELEDKDIIEIHLN